MLLAASALSLVVSIGSGDAPKQDFETRVDIAIEKGVKYLRGQMERDPWKAGKAKKYYMGRPAIEVYALIKSDVSIYDPVVLKAFQYLETLKPRWTYGVSMYLMALDAILSQLETDAALARGRPGSPGPVRGTLPSKVRRRMKEMTDWLVRARKAGAGVWDYSFAKGRYDNSNTQFAVLALGVAAKRGLNVPLAVWEEIANHFITTQAKNGPRVDINVSFHRPEPTSKGRTSVVKRHVGEEKPPEIRARGWGYQEKGEKLTMTAAGLSSLILAREYLFASKAYPLSQRKRLNQAIWDGTGWLVRDGLNYRGWYYYALYSVEKVGDLGMIERFGDIDWYRHGAELILESQRKDGSWSKKEGHDVNHRYQTSLALLFLNRATDLLVHSRPLVLTGKGSSEKIREGWVYVGRLRGEVSVRRMFRKLKYNPQRKILRVGADIVKDAMNLGRAHELIDPLIELTSSPYKQVVEFARRSLSRITGEEHEDVREYSDWAKRWRLVAEAGKNADTSKIGRLRELLREEEGSRRKGRIVWARQRMRATEAVGDIIDQLESDDADYRAKAYRALKFITFKDLPFSPTGSAAVRRKQIEAWRAWLQSSAAGR
jgi:hypothetical protein